MITIYADDNKSSRLIMKKILNEIDENGTHYFVDNAAEAIELLSKNKTDVIFLDVEMPGINGMEASRYIETNYPGSNVIFVTGHPEYAIEALKVYCSGFIEKPFDEEDVRDALVHLRYPIKNTNECSIQVRCSHGFGIYANGKHFSFKRKLTTELFAYLVYKNGTICTNGELIGVLWEGDARKSEFLRQLVKDMRDSFENVGISNMIVKRHGSVGLNTDAYVVEGNISKLIDEFQWF